MLQSARIPPDPVGSPEKLRADLIEQILEFQTRYGFTGPVHTKESLNDRATAWLERMNNFQLMAIANSMVSDLTYRERNVS